MQGTISTSQHIGLPGGSPYAVNEFFDTLKRPVSKTEKHMYLFQISNYDDPAVDRETAELLHRHLEAESRRRCPAMWNAIDRIRTHAAKGPARERRTVRYRIYGVFLLALGLLTLILGLMPPRATDVIIVGGAVIIAGLLEFALARGRTPPRIPASCKKEARKALELRRAVDWEKLKTAIRFEDAGITICAEENEEHLSYTRIRLPVIE